ncbi:MAG TPA: PLD nuclease N-terminal domain-containing protein [Actinomycetes bacterium]|nr:PLD nuclease N-terminal domain-containing protein [Actinomycetes bacterium]
MEDAAFMLKVLLYLLPLALAIYALVDLVQTKDDEIQGLPKLAWVGLIVVFWVIGPIAWLLAGKRGGRSFLPDPQARAAGGPTRGRPVAPDDDPDFLRGLGRQSPPPAPRPVDPEDDTPDDPPITAR